MQYGEEYHGSLGKKYFIRRNIRVSAQRTLDWIED